MQAPRLSSLLIVDDSELDGEVVSLACASLGCQIETTTDPEAAIRLYQEKRHSLVLVDYMMGPINGIDLVNRFRQMDPSVNCVMMSGNPDSRLLSFLHEAELPDVVTKPIKPQHLKDQIRISLGRGFGRTAQVQGISLSLKMDLCLPLQGESLEIVQVRQQISKYLKAPDALIIQGSAGLGKPELARFIHQNGMYANAEFRYVDCRDVDGAELARLLVSREAEPGEWLSTLPNSTLVIGHPEAMPRSIQEVLAFNFDELRKQFHFLFLVDLSVDELMEQGMIVENLYFALELPTVYLPDLAERPTDVEAIIRFIYAHKEAFRFEPAPGEGLDYTVATLRRMPLPRNIDELFERVVGRPCRRSRSALMDEMLV